MSQNQSTGACGYNRPCAHQYVGKSQSVMLRNGRLIPHASVGGAGGGAIFSDDERSRLCLSNVFLYSRVRNPRRTPQAANTNASLGLQRQSAQAIQSLRRIKSCTTDIYLIFDIFRMRALRIMVSARERTRRYTGACTINRPLITMHD